MFGDEFTPIPYDIIKSLKSKLDAKGIYEEKVLDIDYEKGDTLTIKEGKFAGIDAIFLSLAIATTSLDIDESGTIIF